MEVTGQLQDTAMMNALPETPARTCQHTPACPPADALDRDAAHVLVAHPEQGWSLLCNGVVLFEDMGELLPHGQSLPSRRRELLATCPHRRAS